MDKIYYNIVGLLSLLASPLVLARMLFDPGFRAEMTARLRNWKTLPRQKDCVWVHASSVGEVQVAKLLIRAMLRKHPDRPVVLSTFTATGQEVAQAENVCPVFRLPLDLPWLLNPMLDRLNPAMLVLIEAEFWPALLRLCRQRGIPVVLANGRMSERAFGQYAKIQPIFLWLTENIIRFAMRSPVDADRVRRLGIAEERVMLTGNMKFDALPPPGQGARVNGAGPQTVVFGSTRPGDEAPILDAIVRLRAEFPDARYILAPRHVQRTEEVAAMLRARNLEFGLHSARNGDGEAGAPPILLVDMLGRLNDYYRQASVAFVGGGFSPEFGGQNILEPALLGVPVLFGRHMQNFQEEARLLAESGGGIQIENPEALYPALRALMAEPEERRRRGSLAALTVESNRGAVERNLQLIDDLLDSPCIKVLRTQGPQ